MIKQILLPLCIFLLLILTLQPGSGQIKTKTSWQPLLDRNLTNWDIFIGVPQADITVPGYTEESRQKQLPLGLNNDPLHVFSVQEENGQPVLHISGQILGGLSTKKEYQNYHLKFKFK